MQIFKEVKKHFQGVEEEQRPEVETDCSRGERASRKAGTKDQDQPWPALEVERHGGDLERGSDMT